jgi:hypothetical protein
MRGYPSGKTSSQISEMRRHAALVGWSKPLRRSRHFRMMKRRNRNPRFIKIRKRSLQTSSFREKRSRFMKRQWKDKTYREGMIRVIKKVVSSQTSGIQISIFRSLCRRGFKGVRLNFPVSSRFADIAFPKAKIAIELDGWLHAERKKSDRKRDRLFSSLGWQVKRFPARWRSLIKILSFLEEKL